MKKNHKKIINYEIVSLKQNRQKKNQQKFLKYEWHNVYILSNTSLLPTPQEFFV